MLVLHRNQKYELNMPFSLFESIKLLHPDNEVEILEFTTSNYKELKKVPIREIEDYSIARNLYALST